MHVACHIDQMHLCWENSRFGPTDGRNSTKLPCKGSLCRQGTAALAHHPQSESKTSLPIKVVCCRRETAASCWLQTVCVRFDWQLPPTCKTPPTARRQWRAVKKLQAALTPLLAFHLKGPSLLGLSQTQKPSPSPQVYSSNLVCMPNGTFILDACLEMSPLLFFLGRAFGYMRSAPPTMSQATALSCASQTSGGLHWGCDSIGNTLVVCKLYSHLQ